MTRRKIFSQRKTKQIAIFMATFVIAYYSLVSIGQEKKTDKKKTDKIEFVIGKIKITNDSKLKPDFRNAKFELSEILEPETPKLPDGFEKLDQQKQQEWFQKFLSSKEGQAFAKKQQERFAARKTFKIYFDDDGSFKVKNVPFGQYQLNGELTATAKTKQYSALIFAAVNIKKGVNQVDLGKIEVEMKPFLTVGDTAPDFELSTVDDKKVKLSQFRGKYVLLDFWSSADGPSTTYIEKIKEIYSERKPKGNFEIIGVSLDVDRKQPAEFVKTNGLKWVQAFAGPDWEQPAVSNYGVQGIPSFWLIGPKGKILATDRDFLAENLDFEKVLKDNIKLR